VNGNSMPAARCLHGAFRGGVYKTMRACGILIHAWLADVRRCRRVSAVDVSALQ
jgi:hypothetical protein